MMMYSDLNEVLFTNSSKKHAVVVDTADDEE